MCGGQKTDTVYVDRIGRIIHSIQCRECKTEEVFEINGITQKPSIVRRL